MGAGHDTAGDGLTAAPLAPAPYQSQASFVAALCQGEPAALRAFFLFYAPLLRDQARKLSVPEDERSELVTTVLDDVVLHLQDVSFPPRDLSRYVVGALRNRVRTRHRDRERRRVTTEHAYATLDATSQRVVAECHSEYGLREAVAPGSERRPPLAAAIEKLAAASARALSTSELALMVGLGHRIPLRELAAQAGISYGAARVRVHRLRARFLVVAMAYVASLDAEEQREMMRFFRRAGVALAAHEPADSPATSGDDHIPSEEIQP
ncbi:MAG: hypothetical protein JWM95_63 [Gemmatimonadetes bacterium]|nr:hypothetical protein [Gemmatimonadota bacterium]